jgi:nitroreductase
VNEIKQLLFGLRSNRFFSEEPLKKEDVDQILEAMINSPSAGNEQNRKYYVLSTPGKISELEDDIQQIYMNIAKTYKNPIVMIIAGGLLKKHIQEVYQEYNTELSQMDLDLKTKELILSLSIIKKDFYCRKAPQIILVTSDVSKKGVHKDFYKADVEIAVTHGAIMASALGISSCRLGLVEMQINKNKDLLKKLNIPAHEKVNGIISFGYSTVNWVRTPPRGPAQVMWL